MALFNADSYQEVSIDWPTVNTQNMIIDGGKRKQCVLQGSWDEVRDRLIAYTYKLDLTRPDEITEKHEQRV